MGPWPLRMYVALPLGSRPQLTSPYVVSASGTIVYTCRLCSLVVYSIDKHPLSLAEEMLELTRLIILKSPIKR